MESAYDSHSTWSWNQPTTCTLHEDELGLWLALCTKLNSAYDSHSTWSWTRLMTHFLWSFLGPTTCILNEDEFGLYKFPHKWFISQRLAHDMKRKSHTYNVHLKHSLRSEYLTNQLKNYLWLYMWIGWPQFLTNFRTEVFTAVTIHTMVVCVVIPCRLVDETDVSKERTAPYSA
jgi:hypothetical protein